MQVPPFLLFHTLKLTKLYGRNQYIGTKSEKVHRRLGWRSHQRLSRSRTRSSARRHAWEQKRRSGDRLLRWNSSYHPGRSQEHEKKFSCDDPRAACQVVFLLLAFLLPHSVSAALNAANLFPAISFPVCAPGFPLSPFCRLIPAMFAAIAFPGMIRPEYEPTAFQQTQTGTRPPRISLDTTPYSFCLIFELSCRMFTIAHGSLLLPEGSSLEVDPFPFGAF